MFHFAFINIFREESNFQLRLCYVFIIIIAAYPKLIQATEPPNYISLMLHV